MQNPTRPVVVLLAAATFALTAPAQSWRSEAIVEAGIEIEAPSRLERLPMQLGDSSLYQRARLRPKDRQDFVRSQYYWQCDVYEFTQKEPKGDDSDIPSNAPPEVKAQIKALLAGLGDKRHKTFKSWLDEQKQTTILVDGKPVKGKSGKLDYAHWVWKVKDGYGPCGISYCEAAVYSLEDREVALVIDMPLESESHAKPKSKYTTLIDKMIASGKALDAAAAEEENDAKRDKYADTPQKKEALTKAKANIAGLKGWDYFTQPNYIVFYSWDFEKPLERSKSKKDAEYYSSRLEKMRALYIENYPLDETGLRAIMPDPNSIPSIKGPITGESAKPAEAKVEGADGAPELETHAEPLREPFSVFRLCSTYDQFQKYGQSPSGVVGWFSPSSKELVVFLGGDQMMGSGATETVTYHEGWHQFADFYFGSSASGKHVTLQRWFDEGTGDYFGSFRWGSSGWKYLGSKMRYDECKEMVRVGDFVPWKEILKWPVQRFYTDRPSYRYAQAYSMIDFLRRGEKLGRGWQERYRDVLDMYRKVVLVHGDAGLAVDTAFRDFKDEDWAQITEAWKAWVKSAHFENGQ
ncbi:MAG TPA: hypothetical protein VFZ65_17110 [Planctomycetota bacterium]|nr:hypothetical protein [Planctomycetota bacterium]